MGFYKGLFWALGYMVESKPSKNADDKNGKGTVNHLKDRIIIQRDLDKLKN